MENQHRETVITRQMNYFIVSILVLLLLQRGAVCGGEIVLPSVTHWKNVSMKEFVDNMRILGVSIDFEEVFYDKKDDITVDEAIKELDSRKQDTLTTNDLKQLAELREIKENDVCTVADAIKELESKGTSMLTTDDRENLEYYRKAQAQGGRRLVIGKRKRRFDILAPTRKQEIEQTILSAVQKDADYAWKKSNVSYIIYAKGIEHPKVRSVVLQAIDIKSAYAFLQKDVLVPCRLRWAPSVGKDPILENTAFNSVKIRLDLSDTDLHTVLTRFTEAVGSNVVWTINGGWRSIGERQISFKVLNSVDALAR